MIIEMEVPAIAESRTAIDGLREAVDAVRRHYETGFTVSADFGQIQLVVDNSNRQLTTVSLVIDPDYPIEAVGSLWPWISYLHALSNLPVPIVHSQPARDYRPARVPRRQPAMPRAATPVGVPAVGSYCWDDRDRWRAAGETAVAFGDMETEWLWATINWCVRNAVRCWQLAGLAEGNNRPPLLAAGTWLGQQLTFRGFIQEAARRGLTFPEDVATFLSRYSTTAAAAKPWFDPTRQAEQTALRDALLVPTSEQPPARNGFRRRVQAAPQGSHGSSNNLGSD